MHTQYQKMDSGGSTYPVSLGFRSLSHWDWRDSRQSMQSKHHCPHQLWRCWMRKPGPHRETSSSGEQADQELHLGFKCFKPTFVTFDMNSTNLEHFYKWILLANTLFLRPVIYISTSTACFIQIEFTKPNLTFPSTPLYLWLDEACQYSHDSLPVDPLSSPKHLTRL